jgi:hypothetical protein
MGQALAPFLKSLAPDHPWHAEARDRIRAAPLERLLSVLQDVHGRHAIEQYLAVLESSTWNYNHAAIAAAARAGHVPTCVTLNFDLLIEEAAKAHGISSEVVCPLSNSGKTPLNYGDGPPRLRLVKPHGSLAPAEWGVSRFALLAATLDDIGNHPRGENIAAIETLLDRHPVLLVGGYSDHDWDVWPILQRNRRRLRHVHWVHYVEQRCVRAREFCPDERLNHVLDWLRNADVPHTIWAGDIGSLFSRLLSRLSCVAEPTCEDARRPVPKPNGDVFTTPHESLVRTALAATLLWQDRRGLGSALRGWLHTHGVIQRDPWLHARLHRTTAQTDHTEHRLRRAMRHMRTCIMLKLRAAGPGDASAQHGEHRGDPSTTPRGLGHDLVWLAYEHLCLIKRPSFSAPWAFFGRRRHLDTARGCFDVGLALSKTTDRQRASRLEAQAHYYLADLRHAWAELSAVLAPTDRSRMRASFATVCRVYDRALAAYPWLFDEPYYRLRRLEARLFGGVTTPEERAEAKDRFDEIIAGNQMLHSHVQSGNAYLYQAVLRFHECRQIGPAERRELTILLQRARREWTHADAVVASGLRRIAVYRRVFGFSGLTDLVLEFIRLWATAHFRERRGDTASRSPERREAELHRCAARNMIPDALILLEIQAAQVGQDHSHERVCIEAGPNHSNAI